MPKRISVLLEVLAVTSFGMTLFLLWSDKTSSAGVAVALSFGALLFRILPDLESFEILGLKAKLRERLQEADQILDIMRDQAEVTAKASILSIAWSNRFDGMKYSQQSELLDEHARVLKVLGIKDATINEVKKPALVMFSNDIATLFQQPLGLVISRYSEPYRQSVQELRQPLPDPELETERARKSDHAKSRLASYDNKVVSEFFSDDWSARGEPIGSSLNVLVDKFRLSVNDRNALIAFAKKLSDVDAINWSIWRLGEEVGVFLETRDHKYSFSDEVFPDGISGPDWNTAEE
jgi:hypothetical protein